MPCDIIASSGRTVPTSEEEGKKPYIDYKVSYEGNVIEAQIDEKTSFISLRRALKKRKKGALSFLPSIRGEGEIESEDEWITVVWEGGELMPPSVWDEKRRQEIMTGITDAISTVTGSSRENVRLASGSGTLVPWPSTTTCRNCGSLLSLGAKYCHVCGSRTS